MTHDLDVQRRADTSHFPLATSTTGRPQAQQYLPFGGWVPAAIIEETPPDLAFPTAAPVTVAVATTQPARWSSSQDGVLGFVLGMVCLTFFLTLLATFAATSG